MNTRIWGPPTWRFLHGTSYLGKDDRKTRDAICTMMRSLAHVMPCVYCRNSYSTFTTELHMDDLSEIVKAGEYSRWLYDLHNKVVNKLQRQVFDKVGGIPLAKQDAIIAENLLPYDVLRKRLMTCMPYFSQDDVLLMLGIFGLGAKEDSNEDRKEHYLAFARSVCFLLTATRIYAPLADKLCASLKNISVATFDSRILAALASLDLGRKPTESEVSDYCTVLGIVKAGSCSRGSCV